MANRTTVINIRSGEYYDVYIGRGDNGLVPTRSGAYGYFGNTVRRGSRRNKVVGFTRVFVDRMNNDEVYRSAIESLQGKVLGCFCHPKLCHGHVIALWLNRYMVT